MKYIIVWRVGGHYADLNSWHEPNRYNSKEDAIKAMSTWLFPYSKGYYEIIPWNGQVEQKRFHAE